MRVPAILRRWIEVLAALLLGARDAWRARRALIVRRDADGFQIRQAGPGAAAGQILCTAPLATPVGKEVSQIARKGQVIVELPPEKVMARRISVPAKAREFLTGIIRNQIDRLSPWQADQALYGFAAKASPEDPATLDVRVMITSRAIVDAARDEIAAIGLPVDSIVVRESDADSPAAVALWSRGADATREEAGRVHRIIGLTIAAAVACSIALTVWAMVSAAAMRDAAEDAEARTKDLQHQLRGARNAVANVSADPAERAWIAKQTAPCAVVSLEALSRALPDGAYLTDLQFEHASVRMIGLAADAPSLVAPLERSGHFTGVHFFAPTTRGADAALYRFHLEAQVEPRLDLDKD